MLHKCFSNVDLSSCNNHYKKYKRCLNKWCAITCGRRPVVKVYGLLRTGTNYITRLIDLNFDVFCLESTEEGWKHGPCNYHERFYYVFMVKDPYSWLSSFYEWELIHNRTKAGSLSEFITGPVTHPELQRAWSIDYPISAWSESLRSWSIYKNENNVIFLKYEDLLESFTDQLANLSQRFGFKPKNEVFLNLTKRADDWATPKPRKKLSQDYYTNKEYLKQFTSDDIEFIQKCLDMNMVEEFGYCLPQQHDET